MLSRATSGNYGDNISVQYFFGASCGIFWRYIRHKIRIFQANSAVKAKEDGEYDHSLSHTTSHL